MLFKKYSFDKLPIVFKRVKAYRWDGWVMPVFSLFGFELFLTRRIAPKEEMESLPQGKIVIVKE